MNFNSKGLRQLRQGHPWIYDDMIDCKEWPQKPGVYPLGEHWFFYTPTGKLRLRRLGPSRRLWPMESAPRIPILEPANFREFFFEPLRDELTLHALNQSKLVAGDPCFRWIFAENQGLPGLIVDVFSNTFVAQIQTAPIEFYWEVIKEICEAAFERSFPGTPKPRWIEDRSSTLRTLEGLEVKENSAAVQLESVITWNGLKWKFRPGSSQKTGAYLDQRDNHLRTKEWAARLGIRKIWDLCCFEGGFGLHLAKSGAEILFLDQSEKALSVVRENLQLNGLAESSHTFVKDDIFKYLRDQAKLQPKNVPGIVLDPPSFTRNRKEKPNALRGYFELHRQALKLLQPGGLLVTCSCSHHVTSEDLIETLREASHSTRRDLRIIDRGGPAADHGNQVSFPEAEYLHAVYAVVGG
jgi:23S rRNA (cytosine1962-C5)-methyltransferase